MNLNQFLIHFRLKSFQKKLNNTIEIVKKALDKMENPYIAFSGGIDSTAVLHLVRSIKSDIIAVFGHDEWILPETEQFINQTENVIKTALKDRHSEWFMAWEDISKVPDDIILIPKQYTEFTYHKEMFDFDGCFLGLRADENSYRKIHFRKKGCIFFCNRHKMIECSPIAWWSRRDVWAYIVGINIEYNRAYDKLSQIGVEIDRQRVGPISQWLALGYGQLAILKQGWPELFNKFANAYPEARSYV